MKKTALVIVDFQRGFNPESETERLGLPGFGELPVPGAQRLIPNINRLTQAFWEVDLPVMTTQDWHPKDTAHFSDNPNYVDTWDEHCVANTDGAKLHPELLAAQYPDRVRTYHKGMEAAASPAEDTSYTGVLAINIETGATLPEDLAALGIGRVVLVGVALGDGWNHPLCVDSTALGLFKQGYEVNVVTDATEAVLPGNKDLCFRNFSRLGIKLPTANEALSIPLGR